MKKRMKKLNKKPKPFIFYESLSLVSLSISLIALSSIFDDGSWWQTLFISLGTGVIASAIVSLAFWVIQRENEKRTACKRRFEFMGQFKILSYNILHDINYSQFNGEELSLNEFIKAQHRWFHEYYKRMVANNTEDYETELRVKQITLFVKIYHRKFISIFENRVVWEDGDFSEHQLEELKKMYNEFYDVIDFLNNKDYMQAFLSMASFLETFKRIMTEDGFKELLNFDLMRFNYDKSGHMNIIYGE
ncbi:MAG: hypothetical protein ACI4MC_01875, partial [Candidatus Coproplasma sp.]